MHMLTVCWLMQELPRAPSLRDSVRTSSLQTPSAPAAAEPPPPSFAISLAGEGHAEVLPARAALVCVAGKISLLRQDPHRHSC
jgi:hypothetical protein